MNHLVLQIVGEDLLRGELSYKAVQSRGLKIAGRADSHTSSQADMKTLNPFRRRRGTAEAKAYLAMPDDRTQPLVARQGSATGNPFDAPAAEGPAKSSKKREPESESEEERLLAGDKVEARFKGGA